MRKGIFLNFPTHGCINSLLATASELVDRGQQIIYYCTEEFRNKIEQTGAEFRPYNGLINEVKIEKFDLIKALKLNIEMTVDKLNYNLDAIRKESADYIIHDSLCTWGKHIAKVLALPAVNLMHSFPITKTSVSFTTDTALIMFRIGLYKIKNRFLNNTPLKILKDKYDIELSLGDVFINKEDLNIIYTSKHTAPDTHHSEKTYKFVGPSLFFKQEQDDFPFHKLEGKKVIYISLGTLLSDEYFFYKKCIKAFSNAEYFIIISIGFEIDLAEFSSLPDNFIIRRSVPQQKLLEHVAVFITHAGMNSVNEAICNGVPMVLLPHTIEQKMIARRIQEMGMGIVMNVRKLTKEMLYENTKRLISDSEYKKRAFKYRSIFKEEAKTSHLKASDEILNYLGK